ncbi:MAG TPA: Flp pilus assembly complex ATPase component TadA [Nanoarchaeota archaeon]|nr:Flp pilus assembly complex ATPase component TadA [Nanoarchaeota archaeon]
MKPVHTEKMVPDSSVIIEGVLSRKIKANAISVGEVIVPEGLVLFLEQEAAREKAAGYLGLDELKRLRDMLGDNMKISGRRPSSLEISKISFDDIDSFARQLAFDENAVFVTVSKSKHTAAEATGVKSILVVPEGVERKLKIESFFDAATMSVHLKEDVIPYAKRGMPGKWDFVALGSKPILQEEIKEISREIIESPKERIDSFIEIERAGSTIVQMGHYRIVITRPPFSDGWEITAVKPIKQLNINDYNLSPELSQRIDREATGILIAGAPGNGKTTFASSLAEYYAAQNKTVKTIEAPRDMILSPSITQYSISHGDAQEVHDILLLSRPDYCVFDEMRNTKDFALYIDLRLAGIGLAGVVHATNPVDAIQRFIGRAELGVIPQVIDTVIFIKDGAIGKVLSIKMTVKVPSGMTEADLARPVVEVRDFESKQLEYEMYSYGEETVVVPIGSEKKTSAVHSLATRQIENAFMEYTSAAQAEMISENKVRVYVPERDMARIIGKEGKTISEIERRLGLNIQLEPMKSARPEGKPITFTVKERGNYILLFTNRAGASVDAFVEDSFLFTSTTSKKGEIKISKKGPIGSSLLKAMDLGKKVELKMSE